MSTLDPVSADGLWPYLATLLPGDVEETARASGALVRCRNVPSAEALMRLVLAYAVSDLSMKDVAAWAKVTRVATISGPGLFYRMRMAEQWLEQVLAQTVESETGLSPVCLPLRIVDATVITGPGSRGTDWRVHARIDPDTGRFRSVEITDPHGGEGYGRHAVTRGEIIVGDRGYASAPGIAAVTAAGSYVLVRLNPYTIRICDENRRQIRVLDRAAQVPTAGVVTWTVNVPVPPVARRTRHHSWELAKASAWIQARLIAARTRGGDVIWILTTAPSTQLSPLQAAQIYRLRWQVELFFKRLKSLLHLDTLPTRAGPTAKSWMLARLIAAALAQKLAPPEGPLSPWGYVLRAERVHP